MLLVKTLFNLAVDFRGRECTEGPGGDDKRGLLLEHILHDQTVELLRMMPEAPCKKKKKTSPTPLLSPPSPQKASGCTSHMITLKNKVATKRANCQVCPLTHPELVENGSCFFSLQIVMIFSFRRHNWCKAFDNSKGCLHFYDFHIDRGPDFSLFLLLPKHN